MTGSILGYDSTTKTGTILGRDEKRYSFEKTTWKEDVAPTRDQKVDFEVSEGNKAIDIYVLRNTEAENSNTLMGLVSLGITFFFGFIGTFISRLVLSKQSIEKTIIPTLIHFIITMAVIVPVLGWIIYLIGTLYYMVKNYKLVMGDTGSTNKYA